MSINPITFNPLSGAEKKQALEEAEIKEPRKVSFFSKFRKNKNGNSKSSGQSLSLLAKIKKIFTCSGVEAPEISDKPLERLNDKNIAASQVSGQQAQQAPLEPISQQNLPQIDKPFQIAQQHIMPLSQYDQSESKEINSSNTELTYIQELIDSVKSNIKISNNDHWYALNKVGVLLYNRNQKDDFNTAAKLFKAALSLKPTDNNWKIRILKNLQAALMKSSLIQDFKDACKCFKAEISIRENINTTSEIIHDRYSHFFNISLPTNITKEEINFLLDLLFSARKLKPQIRHLQAEFCIQIAKLLLLREQSNDLENAALHYKIALSLATPQNGDKFIGDMLKNLIMTLHKLNDYSDAIQHIQSYLNSNLHNKDEIQHLLAISLYNRNQNDDLNRAIKIWEELTQKSLKPFDKINVMWWLVDIYRNKLRPDFPKIIEYCESALPLTNEFHCSWRAYFLKELAIALFNTNIIENLNTSIEYLQKALSDNTHHKFDKFEILFYLGKLLHIRGQEGDLSSSIEYLRDSIDELSKLKNIIKSYNTNKKNAHMLLGLILLKRKKAEDISEAIGQFRAAIDVSDTSIRPFLYSQLGKALMLRNKKGDFDKASHLFYEAIYNIVKQSSKDSPTNFNRLGLRSLIISFCAAWTLSWGNSFDSSDTCKD